MKKSILGAALWALVAFVLIDFVVAQLVLVALTKAKIDAYGDTSALWDQFASTPLAFLLTGLVFGTIAASRNTLKDTIQPAAYFGATLAIIVPIILHELMLTIQGELRKTNPLAAVGPPSEQQLIMTVAASILWTCWFVAGAAIGHGIRTRKSLPKAA
jgi:uncharacterized protein YacL